MAKVTGPLFSMTASGQLGKAIVYASWKGIEYVREYLIPANPKTANQGDVRLVLGGLARAFGPIERDSDFYDRISGLIPGGQSWISYLISYAKSVLYPTTAHFEKLISDVQNHTAYADWQTGADDANLHCFDIAYKGTAYAFEKAAMLYAIAEVGFSLGFTTGPFATALASWSNTQIDALVAELSA